MHHHIRGGSLRQGMRYGNGELHMLGLDQGSRGDIPPVVPQPVRQ